MEIKQLNLSHNLEFVEMVKETEKHLESPLWFMPFTDKEMSEMLKGKTIITYGVFDNDNKIIAISGLFPDVNEFKDIADFLDIKTQNVTELGGCMVLPKNRGLNLMLKINKV